MPNMSYCRMENTYRDLVDAYNNWEEAESKSELKYRKRILELCKEIVSSFDEMEMDEIEEDNED